MEKISIIIPIYNSELYLKRCLDSIINQTYSNLEIILVNDGSIDNSYQLCLDYPKKDNRIKVFNQKNQGAGVARNLGLKNSTGDYITFIDSDDYIENDYIEYLYNLLVKNDCDIAVTSFLECKKEKVKVINRDIGLKMLANFQIEFAPWGKLYKKSIIKDVMFSKTKNYEDIVFVGKAFFNSRKIVVSNQKKYHYVKRENSQSTMPFNKTEFDRVKNSYELYQFISKNNKTLSKLYKLYYYANCIGCINKMIVSDEIDKGLVNDTGIGLKKELFYLWKSGYSLRRKVQYTCFVFSFKLYKKWYIQIKKD